MLNQTIELQLMSGGSILAPELDLEIHQPTIGEIAQVGEDAYLRFLGVLNTTKEDLIGNTYDIDQINAINQIDDIEIFLALLGNGDPRSQASMQALIEMLFRKYDIHYTPSSIIFKRDDFDFIIDEDKFDIFKRYIKMILQPDMGGGKKFNPQSSRARAIAEKIEAGRQRSNKQSGTDFEGRSILALQASVVSVTLNVPIKQIFDEYTTYQLKETYTRIAKRESYENSLKAVAAGAKDVEVEEWRTPL